jgi:hypothetical protein
MQPNTISQFLTFYTSIFTVEHVLTRWSRILTLFIELLYKISFNLYAVYMTHFDAT